MHTVNLVTTMANYLKRHVDFPPFTRYTVLGERHYNGDVQDSKPSFCISSTHACKFIHIQILHVAQMDPSIAGTVSVQCLVPLTNTSYSCAYQMECFPPKQCMYINGILISSTHVIEIIKQAHFLK